MYHCEINHRLYISNPTILILIIIEVKMELITIALLLLFCLTAQKHNNDKECNDNKRRIIKKLKKLEDSYISTLSFDDRRRAIRIMNNILEELAYVDLPGDTRRRHPRNVMSDEVFANFLKQLKKETVGSKNNLLKESIKFGMSSSNQTAQIIKQYTFDSDQLEAFKICFDKIYDKVNISIAIN